MNWIVLGIYLAASTAIAWMDYKRHIVPDWPLVAIGIIALAVAVLNHNIWVSLIGGILGFGLLAGLMLLTKKLVGWGDIKLAGVVGLVAGPAVLYIIVVSFILGAIISGILLYRKKVKTANQMMAFAPMMLAGALGITIWQAWN